MNSLSTHVLDTSRGIPAAGVSVTLEFKGSGETWVKVGSGVTGNDGRVANLFSAGVEFSPGMYRLHFSVSQYFTALKDPVFYPWVSIVFEKHPGLEDDKHFHIPLILSPFGYSTYRGS